MHTKQMRVDIVNTVSTFAKQHNLNYREVWLQVYGIYEDTYHIPVATWYKLGKFKDKLDFLEAYEDLYKTLTKMYNLIKGLK